MCYSNDRLKLSETEENNAQPTDELAWMYGGTEVDGNKRQMSLIAKRDR